MSVSIRTMIHGTIHAPGLFWSAAQRQLLGVSQAGARPVDGFGVAEVG
jgi:hypothetical protein